MLFSMKIIGLGVAGLIAIGLATGLAFAGTRSAPIGTGVVVINTGLGYQAGAASGTGMVLTSSGEILTNNHVIRGATTIKIVVPADGRSYTAKVVGYDVTGDIAVLQATGASNLKTVALAGSWTVKVGQKVRAVGNAGGTGSLVSVFGSVTGVGRSITVSDDAGGNQRLTGLIETDADLQPGDSGGPLFNAVGKVVGMDTAASAGYGFQRIAGNDGYAIPIAKAIAIAKRIEAGRGSSTVHVGSTAFLGVAVSPSSYDTPGAMIASVVPGGPAAKAGLVPGDLITAIAGRTVTSPTSLAAVMRGQKPTAKVSVRYVDQTGTRRVVAVTLVSGPPQ